ncbi:MAG: hypothetical protein Q9180_001790 [Flavoplaca navasiana]
MERFTPAERVVEYAKRADRSAIRRAIKKIERTPEFRSANKFERGSMVKSVSDQITLKRINQHKHASVLAREQGIFVSSTDVRVWDDGNSDWEDFTARELENDAEYGAAEEHCARDEGARLEPKPSTTESIKLAGDRYDKLSKTMIILEWKTNRRVWRGAIRRFIDKEVAVFRNLQAWHHRVGSDGWYDLPGPAAWWKDYRFDHDECNWDADTDPWAALYAFRLMTKDYGSHVPKDFDRLAPSAKRLGFIDSDIPIFLSNR